MERNIITIYKNEKTKIQIKQLKAQATKIQAKKI